MSNLTEQQISQMRYDEGYQMGVHETAYLIFRDLYGTCPHSRGDFSDKDKAVTMCHCHACDTCVNEIKEKWLKK
jgi:hypothetical protein